VIQCPVLADTGSSVPNPGYHLRKALSVNGSPPKLLRAFWEEFCVRRHVRMLGQPQTIWDNETPKILPKNRSIFASASCPPYADVVFRVERAMGDRRQSCLPAEDLFDAGQMGIGPTALAHICSYISAP
jgi:hypothetical protein